MNLIKILFVDLVRFVLLFDESHLLSLLKGNFVKALSHDSSKLLHLLWVGEQLLVGCFFVFTDDLHAVEELLEQNFNSFQIIFVVGTKNVNNEKIVELLEESGVLALSFGNKQVLESLEAKFLQSFGGEVHMLLKDWKNGSNVWLEAGSHSRGNSQDMVESCDLVFELTSVHADSHAFFHTSDFEVERFLIGTSSGWKLSVFLSKLDLN
jgi:hypothetical protein